MDPVALLAELRALADNIPDFDTFTPSSRVHQEWVGKLHALIEQWKPSEELSLGVQIGWIGIDSTRASSRRPGRWTAHRHRQRHPSPPIFQAECCNSRAYANHDIMLANRIIR